MALTPSDIEQKTFSTTLRGYDLNEVDDFLDDVVATLRDLQDQLAIAKTAQGRTAPSDEESAVGRALIAAQTTGDEMIADAKEEAEKMIADAREEASNWVSEREAKKAEADAEMIQLADHVANVRAQLAVLATLVADRLDEMDHAISGRDDWALQVLADYDEAAITAEDPKAESTGDPATEADLEDGQEEEPEDDGSEDASEDGSDSYDRPADGDSEANEDQAEGEDDGEDDGAEDSDEEIR